MQLYYIHRNAGVTSDQNLRHDSCFIPGLTECYAAKQTTSEHEDVYVKKLYSKADFFASRLMSLV